MILAESESGSGQTNSAFSTKVLKLGLFSMFYSIYRVRLDQDNSSTDTNSCLRSMHHVTKALTLDHNVNPFGPTSLNGDDAQHMRLTPENRYFTS